MKQTILALSFFMIAIIKAYPQFAADYSSYGFNFVNNTYNEGLKNWSGSDTSDTSKFNIYQQDNYNNYALELIPTNETLSINYDDFGYMDMNSCTLKINIRVKINEFSGNNDALSFILYTGAKKVDLKFTSDGVQYTNNENNLEQVTESIAIDEWKTYSIRIDGCINEATLMIENDSVNTYQLNFPDDTTSQNISIIASTDGEASFSSEIDHLFIYSGPIKWWLGSSSEFLDDTPEGYEGTTGDRQHFLSLPNGERIGVNENGGGYVTFTELYPGGANLDPFPKFGSGGTKTLRCYFQGQYLNPVQAGISSVSGGHLATVTTTEDKLSVEGFPLHSYIANHDYIENTPLTFPNGDILGDESYPTVIDEDSFDDFGLTMRDELMTELDFNTSMENVTETDGISAVRHIAEWEYIRHPSFILQFHDEIESHQRPKFVNNDGADNDMGEMRHKFEFRLNKDLGYEWILWRNENEEWESLKVVEVGDDKTILIGTQTAKENRFLVFSTSSDPNEPGAVSWFYPETDFNNKSTLQKSRVNKDVVSSDDRRTDIQITADWRKTNWCRMNLYVRNDGLEAPCNGNPNVYEAFQMEAIQYFGSPNEILNEVVSYTKSRQDDTVHSVDDCALLTNTNTVNATYEALVTNPNVSGNSSTNVSQIINSTSGSITEFALPYSIPVNTQITLGSKFYSENAGAKDVGSGRVQLRFFNSTIGYSTDNFINIGTYEKTGGVWQTELTTVTLLESENATIADNGGYDSMVILASKNTETIEPLYFDDFTIDIDPYLADETADLEGDNIWLYNHSPDDFNASLSDFGEAIIETNQTTPSTIGNDSPSVLKITTSTNTNNGVVFNTGNFDFTTSTLKFRIYPVCNINVLSPNLKIKLRKDGTADANVEKEYTSTLFANRWNEITVDLSAPTNNTSEAPDNLYDQIHFFLNEGAGVADVEFYIDAVQGFESIDTGTLSSTEIIKEESISIYPNPFSSQVTIRGEYLLDKEIKLFSVLGKELPESIEKKTLSNNQMIIGIEKINSGIYFLKVGDEVHKIFKD